MESSRACASALCEPAPSTPAPVRPAAALTDSDTRSAPWRRPAPSAAMALETVATLGTSTHQLSLASCCWRSSLFPRVLACLPGGSWPGCRLKTGVSRNTAVPPQTALRSCPILGCGVRGATRECPPVATLKTATRTRRAHILPPWALASSGAQPAYHHRGPQEKPEPGEWKREEYRP